MDSIQISFLEEFKYVDAICRDMLSVEKGVSAYIEQMEATPFAVRYQIVGWESDYKELKHLRWLRNQIAHSTGYVECTLADLNSLKSFHSRLLTQQDPLACLYRLERQIQKIETSRANTPSRITRDDSMNTKQQPNYMLALAVAACIAVGVGVAIVFLWLLNKYLF